MLRFTVHLNSLADQTLRENLKFFTFISQKLTRHGEGHVWFLFSFKQSHIFRRKTVPRLKIWAKIQDQRDRLTFKHWPTSYYSFPHGWRTHSASLVKLKWCGICFCRQIKCCQAMQQTEPHHFFLLWKPFKHWYYIIHSNNDWVLYKRDRKSIILHNAPSQARL